MTNITEDLACEMHALEEEIQASKLLKGLKLIELRKKCLNAQPTPHISIDGMWNDELLDNVRCEVEVLNEWAGEKQFVGSRQKRWQSDWENFPPNSKQFISYLNQPLVLRIIEFLFNEQGLVSDPYLEGGGIHSTGEGGFLKLHADFNWHKKLKLYRRINILVYLNKDWKKEYGGQIELAGKNADGAFFSQVALDPVFNRTLIFITDDHSYHGQPNPVKIGLNKRRNSIAAYYYQANKPADTAEQKRTATNYVDEKGKKLRSGFIHNLITKFSR